MSIFKITDDGESFWYAAASPELAIDRHVQMCGIIERFLNVEDVVECFPTDNFTLSNDDGSEPETKTFAEWLILKPEFSAASIW